MTEPPPTHPTGPDPSEIVAPVDPLDEGLSAELDGESATESDSDAVSAAATDERRRAVASARDLLAVAPPPLDDLARRRLLRNALAEWPVEKGRGARRLNRAVVAAAAVVAVIAVGGLTLKAISNSSDSSNLKASASKDATSETTAVRPTAPLDLHDVSDPEVLRKRVEAALQDRVATLQSTTPENFGSAAPGAGKASDSPTTAVAGPSCASTVRMPSAGAPIELADATFHGTPAVVVVAHDGDKTLIYVFATADCRLLSYQFLKR